MTTFIGTSVYGGDRQESAAEWARKTMKAHQIEEEREKREIASPNVYLQVPFTFRQLRGVINLNGKTSRATLKWGLIKARPVREEGVVDYILLHASNLSREGCTINVKTPDKIHIMSFENEEVCRSWFESMLPCSECWKIGCFYETDTPTHTERRITASATHRNTGTRVIMRVINWDKSSYRSRFEDALMESDVHACLNHPNVHPACDILMSKTASYIILPSIHGTVDVMNYEWNRKRPDQVRDLARQLLSGALALHKAGFVSHTIHSENVGYIRNKDGSLRYLISDLSGMERIGSNGVVPWKCYTCTKAQYAAPEMKGSFNYMKGRGTTGKVDVFAIGCVLGEFVLNQCLFGRNAYKIFRRERYDLRDNLKMWNVAELEMKKYVGLLVEPDVNKRPNATQALKHSWMEPH